MLYALFLLQVLIQVRWASPRCECMWFRASVERSVLERSEDGEGTGGRRDEPDRMAPGGSCVLVEAGFKAEGRRVCVSRRPCNRFKIATTTLTYHDLMVELKATGSSNNIQQHPFRVLKPPLIPFKERHVYLIYSVHTLKHFIAPDLIGGFVSEPCSAPGGPCSL